MDFCQFRRVSLIFPEVKISEFWSCWMKKWKDARVVEWDGLENRCTGNRTEGSNPSLSANQMNAPPALSGVFLFSAAGASLLVPDAENKNKSERSERAF